MKALYFVFLTVSASLVTAQVASWGQCGGIGYSGSKTCASGNCCTYSNDYYSQCIPGSCSGGGGGGSPTTTAAASGSSATLCAQYGYLQAAGYYFNNNEWGKSSASSGSQCTYYKGTSGSGVAWSTQWQWQGNQNQVKSYPYSGKTFTPKKINSISSLQSEFSWSYSTSNIAADVAYDLFTSTDPNHSISSGDYELMIWLAAYGGVGPISSSGSPIATVSIAGHSWKLYYGLNGSMKVYSFIISSGVLTSFSGDVKQFFNHLTNNYGFPASNQYLITFQGGTETFTGGPATFSVSRFSASVN